MRIEIKKDNHIKKKIETSKLVLGSVLVLTYLFVIFVCVLISITLDLSPLMYLIPAIFGLATTAVGFYSWKAKTENKIKLEIIRIQEEQKLKKKYKDDSIKINTEEKEEITEGDGLG